MYKKIIFNLIILLFIYLESYSQLTEKYENINKDKRILVHLNTILDTLKSRNDYKKDISNIKYEKLIFINKILDIKLKCNNILIIEFGRFGSHNNVFFAYIIDNKIYFDKDFSNTALKNTSCNPIIIYKIDELLKEYDNYYYNLE